MTNSAHIAVIGAGIAGLSCATALQHAGFRVSIFDKSGGPAGRMSTRRGDGWQCDHGAQYFTARDPDFRAEVGRWEQAGAAAQWYPVMRRFNADGTTSGCGTTERFVGTPRMTAPAVWLASSLALRTGLAIGALLREDAGWRLAVDGAGPLDSRYDAVVPALPAPQAAALLHGVAPLQAALAAGARMEGCWAMMLQYSAPLALGFDAAFVNRGALRWAARDSAKPGRSGSETWLLHASAEWSEARIECDAGSVAALLLAAFAELGGSAPECWSAHRWRYASTAQRHNEVCVWDGGQGLGLCGDWLNGGSVEAAWLSGRALAQRICAGWGAGGMR
jgi:predicted NAD/FAD-dependent oxidoreductase